MTKTEIRNLVEKDIREYRYVPPSGTFLGVPFSEHKMNAQLEDLRRHLREPLLVPFSDGASRWIVTQTDQNGYFVFFDEDSSDYGLGIVDYEGKPEDINVHGNLVGTYAAR
jgi:hypothetical protein